MCSLEKHSMKNSDNKNIFHLNEKNAYDKNVSYWLQIYFNWIKIYFDIMKKVNIMKIVFIEYIFILNESKYFLISRKKGHLIKIYFIKCKVILIEWNYISISYVFLFLQNFSNHSP